MGKSPKHKKRRRMRARQQAQAEKLSKPKEEKP